MVTGTRFPLFPDRKSYIHGKPNLKATMPTSILSLRKGNRLLPVVSLLTMLLLVTGECFNCCRINEAFANDVQRLLASMGMAHDPGSDTGVSTGEDRHPGCHGHALPSPSASTSMQPSPEPAHAAYSHEGSCISEQAITRKSMVGSESFALVMVAWLNEFRFDLPPIAEQQFTRPRPQNRSSPPLYLLTLRILV
jgi:hypothetical protein